MALTGKSGLKIIFQKAGIRGRKTADYPLGRKIYLDPEQTIGVVPRTMDPFNPIGSRWGGLKQLLQRKRAVEVEDVDPRTREAIVEGYEALMWETGKPLKGQHLKNYEQWKGESQTSFEFVSLTDYKYRAGYEYDSYEVGLGCVLEPEVAR